MSAWEFSENHTDDGDNADKGTMPSLAANCLVRVRWTSGMISTVQFGKRLLVVLHSLGRILIRHPHEEAPIVPIQQVP